MGSYTYGEAVLFRWYFSSASVRSNTYQVICFRDEETKTDMYKLLSSCKLTNASTDVLKNKLYCISENDLLTNNLSRNYNYVLWFSHYFFYLSILYQFNMLCFCIKINNINKIITLINKVINISKICFYCEICYF